MQMKHAPMRMILILLLGSLSFLNSFSQSKKDSTKRSDTVPDKPMTEEEFLITQGYSFSDTAYKKLSANLKQVSVMLNETSIQLKGNYDTAFVVDYLPGINENMNQIRGYLVKYGANQSLRTLNAAYSQINQYNESIKTYQQRVFKYYDKLVKIKEVMNSLTSDSLYKQLPTDSMMRDQIVVEAFLLTTKLNNVDTLRKTHLAALAKILIKLTDTEYTCAELLNTLKEYIAIGQNNFFIPDTKPLWQAKQSDYVRVMDSSVRASVYKNVTVVKLYTLTYRKYFYVFIALVLLLFFWMRRNVYLMQKNNNNTLIEGIVYLKGVSLPAAIAFVSIVYPFILPNPPNLIVEGFWLIMLLSISLIVWKVWRGPIRYLWMVNIVVYLCFSFDNMFFETGLIERWALFFGSFLALLWGLRLRKAALALDMDNKGPIIWAAWFFVASQAFAMLLNVFGWFNLTKILISAGVNGLNFGVSLQIMIMILAEAIYLQVETRKNSRLKKYFDFDTFTLRFRSVLNWFAIICWVLAILWGLGFYYFLSEQLMVFLGKTRTIGHYTYTYESILIFLVVIIISSIISRLLNLFYNARNETDIENVNKPKVGSWVLILRLLVLTGGFLLAMLAAGIPLDKLAIVFGALGVGIGFGLQNIVNNLVSGIILVFEHPMKVGDTIEVGDKTGVVKEIGIRSSKIVTSEGSDVYVPNGELISNKLVNWSNSNHSRKLEVLITVSQDTDLEKVATICNETLLAQEGLADAPKPAVLVKDTSEQGVIFRMVFYALNSSEKDITRSRVTKNIFEALQASGIKFPLSQQALLSNNLSAERPAGKE